MEELLLPRSISYTDLDQPHTAEVVITPCYHGYGTTLGNMLRRVLLSSLPGAAVTAVKIKGVSHEFSASEGLQEDVVQILLNLKKLRVRVHSDQPVKITLKHKGEGDVTGASIEDNADVDVINKDLVIAHSTDGSKEHEMEIIVQQGRGYVPVHEREEENLELGMIGVDAVYAPVEDVGYAVEMTRVGDITNYEKLTMRVQTDGSITPKEAVDQATKIMLDHLNIILAGASAAELEAEVAGEVPPVEEEVEEGEEVPAEEVSAEETAE